MFKEFKDFIFKGNVVDLAVAVIIGAAFGAIVTSLIEDIITPLLLNPALKAAHVDNIAGLRAFGTTVIGADGVPKMEGGIAYGSFLAKVINFLIIAFVLFMIVKAVNKATKAKVTAPEEPVPTPANEILLAEIRDLLKK